MNRSRPDPVRIGRVVAHHPLVEQVGQRRQAHRGAGVAVADLLHGVGGEQPGGVDGLGVEVGPPLRVSGDDARLLARFRVAGARSASRGAATLAHIGNGPFAHRERARRWSSPPAWIKRSQSATTRTVGLQVVG